jgi:hypothetical protein
VAAARERRQHQRQQRERVEEAAKLCSEVLTAGWQETVADRAADYVTQATLRRLVRRRLKRQCKALAQLASTILAGRQHSHELIGRSAGWLVSCLGGSEVTQVFARELASRLPLPSDARLIAVGRGLQITGVLLCVFEGRELTRCQCFIDLAVTESTERVKRILVAALDDWSGLAAFPPSRRTHTWT